MGGRRISGWLMWMSEREFVFGSGRDVDELVD